MRHSVCLPLFVALLTLTTSCDAKKSETTAPKQPATAPIGKIEGALDFPETAVGKSSAKSFSIKNEGNAPLAISSISYPESLSGPDKPASIEPGATLAIEVKFSPAKPGPLNGIVAVTTNAGKLEVPATGSVKELIGILELTKETPFEKVYVGSKTNGWILLRNSGNAPLNDRARKDTKGSRGFLSAGAENLHGPGDFESLNRSWNDLAGNLRSRHRSHAGTSRDGHRSGGRTSQRLAPR
jgi:hypothetical protein